MSLKKCLRKYYPFFELLERHDPDAGRPKPSTLKTHDKKLAEKCPEVNEVEQLDPYMEPVSRPSDVAERLNEKRRLEHEALMKKLADDLNEVNLGVEENVRISSEDVKFQMKANKDELSSILESLDKPEVASYHESVFHELQQKADCLKLHQLQLIEDLYRDLCQFESHRSKENEKIFHLSFRKIEKTAYLLPYEVQTFVELETLKMNQIMLNNRRCYEDLKLKLVLITEQMFKSFMDDVFCTKEKWIRFNLQEALKSVPCEDSKSQAKSPNCIERFELAGYELKLYLSANEFYNVVNHEEWFHNVEDIINAIESHEKMLIEIYKKALEGIRKSWSNEFDEMMRSLTDFDVLRFEERTIRPIMFDVTTEIEDNMESREEQWQSTLRRCKKSLEYAVRFLKDVQHLWSRHYQRLCESKVLVRKAAEKAEENARSALQDLEVKVNVGIDALRQENAKDKLEGLYATVVAALDEIKDKYESNYVSETAIVEEFYKMMDLEADVLHADVQVFIKRLYPYEPSEAPEVFPLFYQSPIKLNENTSYQQIRDFSTRSSAIKFWTYEVCSALDTFAQNARENLKWRAEEWIQNRIQDLSQKLQIRLEIHCKRYDRIKTQICDVRFGELTEHERIYKEHQAGASAIYDKLTRLIEDVSARMSNKAEEFVKKAERVVEEGKMAERAASVKCMQVQLQRDKTELENEVAVAFEGLRGEIEHKISSVQQSNLKFMKSIKLFHENGNYEPDEAKTYISMLETVDKESYAQDKGMKKESSRRETEISARISSSYDDAALVLTQLHEELVFSSETRNAVRMCRTDFQELALEVKCNFEALAKHIDCLITVISDETCFLDEEQDRLWFPLVDTLYKNVRVLLFPLEPPKWSETPETVYRGEDGDTYEMVSKEESVAAEDSTAGRPRETFKDVDYPCKDSRPELLDLDYVAQDSRSFPSVVSKKCWHYMDYVQRLGCEFYNGAARPLIRSDLLKETYEEFGADISEIFRSYALQCERVWLQAVRNFLPLLGQVKTFFREYFDRRVTEHADKVVAALDKHTSDFAECFNRAGCALVDELQELDRKLLPLHGYPRNSKLLQELEEHVVEKTAELDINWEKTVKRYKNSMKCFRMSHIAKHEEIENLRRLYAWCEEAIFRSELAEGLVAHLNECIRNRGFVKKVDHGAEGEKDAEQEFPAASIASLGEAHNLSLEHLEGCLEDSDSYLKDMKRTLAREDSDLSVFDADWRNCGFESWSHLCEPKLGLLLRCEDFEDLATIKVRRMECRYREAKSLIATKENFQKDIIFGWLDSWKSNVAKIAELYTVKYGHLDEAPESNAHSTKQQ